MKRLLAGIVCLAVALATVMLLRQPTPTPQVAAAKRATVAATYSVRADGRVRLLVTSNARRVAVRFTTRGGQRVRRVRLKAGRVRVVLPRRASAVWVRALATTTLARSRWVRATRANRSAPAPVPSAPTPGATDTDPTAPSGQPPLSAADLTAVASKRVYFGHQSVGSNIIAAVPGVFAEYGVTPPPILESATAGAAFLAHGPVGVNGDPLGKVDDFDADLRAGLVQRVDVALMKFCYVDITSGTDVQRVFQHYRSTLDRLTTDHPGVVFVAVTAPLTVADPADNVRRAQFNAMVRRAYPDRLFDLAAVESTAPDGSRVSGIHDGQRYEALYRGYSPDGGHLNPQGAQRAAAEFLRVLGRAGA